MESLLDEEVIEAAFWHFDAERTRTGAERDAFKHQVRHVTRAHLASALRRLASVRPSVTGGPEERESMSREEVLAILGTLTTAGRDGHNLAERLLLGFLGKEGYGEIVHAYLEARARLHW